MQKVFDLQLQFIKKTRKMEEFNKSTQKLFTKSWLPGLTIVKLIFCWLGMVCLFPKLLLLTGKNFYPDRQFSEKICLLIFERKISFHISQWLLDVQVQKSQREWGQHQDNWSSDQLTILLKYRTLHQLCDFSATKYAIWSQNPSKTQNLNSFGHWSDSFHYFDGFDWNQHG